MNFLQRRLTASVLRNMALQEALLKIEEHLDSETPGHSDLTVSLITMVIDDLRDRGFIK